MNGLRKRFFVVAGVLVIALLLMTVLMPLWFPWILPALAEHYGFHYTGYQREGYGRFVVKNVTSTNAAVAFAAAEAHALIPTAYLWNDYVRRSPMPLLRVTNWKLTLHKTPMPTAPTPVYSQFGAIREVADTLHALVPRAELSNGVIQAWGETLLVPSASWTRPGLKTLLQWPRHNFRGSIQTRLVGVQPFEIRLDSDSASLHTYVQIEQDPSGLRVQVTGSCLTNHFEGALLFSPGKQFPDQARFDCHAFQVPADLLRLPRFQDVHGTIHFEWLTNEFMVRLDASAQPSAAWQSSPFRVNLHASGDINSVFVETAVISTPWLKAELSKKTVIKFAPPFLAEPASLQVQVNLNEQSWIAARGQLHGEAMFSPAAEKFPRATFAFTGTGIRYSNFIAEKLTLKGNFAWPWLELIQAQAEFPQNSMLSAEGKIDLQTERIATARLYYKGQYGQELLPSGYSWEQAILSLELAGSFRKPEHSGTFDVQGFRIPYLHTLKLSGSWTGVQNRLTSFQTRVGVGHSTLTAEGAAELGSSEGRLQLGKLELSSAGQKLFGLQKPFAIAGQSPDGHSKTWHIATDSFAWSGPAGDLNVSADVKWPLSGKINGSAKSLHLNWLGEFLPFSTADLAVEELTLAALWNEGPVNYTLNFAATGLTPEKIPFSSAGLLRGDGQGLAIQKLTISSQGRPAFNASGLVPAIIRVTAPFLELPPGAALNFTANARPEAIFWDILAHQIGLGLKAPQLSLKLSGTVAQPEGTIRLETKQIQFLHIKRAAPPLENFHLNAILDRDKAEIDQITFAILGQPAAISAQIPFEAKFWTSLLHGRMEIPDWRKMKADFTMEQSQLSALAPLFPSIISQQGTLKADVHLRPGGNLSGQLTVLDAATVPLPSIGPVRGLQMQIRLQQQTAQLVALGLVGGEPLSIRGHVDLNGGEWLRGVIPPFQMAIHGTNITLARQPQLIVRADLALGVTNTAGLPVIIGGAVRLRDSLYLQEFSVLPGGKVALPADRPPYFSITNEPFGEWHLALQVKGERFLKIRAPVFNGEASGQLHLSGTLKDPIALGTLQIDDGVVRFPFANLNVKQGQVTLTSDNPHIPKLFVTASAQTFGYEVKMQVTGTAEKPIIQFSSTPALGPQQILLMLTTGELPRGALSLSGQQRAQTIAMFLGRSLLSGLGFGIGTANRLTIQSGENLTETGRPTYSIEYKLTPSWSVLGQYDRFSDYNLMLKWNVYSK